LAHALDQISQVESSQLFADCGAATVCALGSKANLEQRIFDDLGVDDVNPLSAAASLHGIEGFSCPGAPWLRIAHRRRGCADMTAAGHSASCLVYPRGRDRWGGHLGSAALCREQTCRMQFAERKSRPDVYQSL
jgi:hypothetical protein